MSYKPKTIKLIDGWYYLPEGEIINFDTMQVKFSFAPALGTYKIRFNKKFKCWEFKEGRGWFCPNEGSEAKYVVKMQHDIQWAYECWFWYQDYQEKKE